MPLERIRCASAKLERQGTLWTPTPTECVQHGMDRENDCGMSGELLEAMFAKQQNRGENISTTSLITDCPRQVVLERKAGYTVDPRRLYAAFRGEMAHKVQEGHMRPGSWGEARVWARHPLEPDQFISCKPDRVDPDEGILWDLKSSEELPKGHWKTPYPKHIRQLQLNRLLIDTAEWIGDAQPVPLKTVMGADGAKLKTYAPNPAWDPMPAGWKPASWEHLYIEYIAFEGTTVLECTRSERVKNRTNDGWHNARVPDIWDDELVYAIIEENYWQVKRGLDALADPDGYVPPVPTRLQGWALDRRSPCNWCDVRPQCMQREVDAGLPSLGGDSSALLNPELLPAR